MEVLCFMANEMIYPVVDEKREKKISICQERLIYGSSEYFFSPHFKRSDEVIEGLLRGYISGKTGFMDYFTGRDYCVKPDFKRKKALPKIKEVISEIGEEDSSIEVSIKDVLGYYSGGHFKKILLTSDRLISNYKRDDNGAFLNCRIRNIDIVDGNIVRDNSIGQEYCFGEFPESFIKLFYELKELNKSIVIASGNHPLNKEMREMRESYLNILVEKALVNGSLSSNEVLRIEIMARQLGIDSMSVLRMISNALALYDKYGENTRGYISESLIKLEKISSKYFYMLYHDVITFELLAQKGQITGVHQNEFSEALSRQCNINSEFRESYRSSMQKLVVGSYALRHTLAEKGGLIKNQEAYENLFNSVEYEYNLQRELLR